MFSDTGKFSEIINGRMDKHIKLNVCGHIYIYIPVHIVCVCVYLSAIELDEVEKIVKIFFI